MLGSSSSPSQAAAMPALGMGGYRAAAAALFTAAQWTELEHQALIYKYLMAGIPVPPDLLLPIRRAAAFDPAAASAFFPNHHHHPSLSYYAYYGKKLDPEPWRCRRTDGKKWRCSKEAYPDSKYCERHMHRGRNRSRKPVESKTVAAQSQSPSSTVTALAPAGSSTSRNSAGNYDTMSLPSLAAGSKAHGLSLGGAGSSQLHADTSSYGSKYLHGAKSEMGELSFFSEASGNARAFTIDSSTDSSWHSMPSYLSSYPVLKTRNAALIQGAYSYSHLEPSQELGQVTIASLSQEQERRSLFGGGFGLTGPVKHENKPLRPFFDEWPGMRESWSEMDDERSNRTSFSTTQLSISMPSCSSPIDN